MAYHFLTNQTPFSWADCMGRLIRTLCSAGWQQIAFSNGTTVNNTAVTNPFPYSANSNSLGTTVDASSNFSTDRAWILLQQPPIPNSGITGSYAGIRQIVIQKTSAATNQWRIKYSMSGGYTVPAATGTVRTTPTVNSTINDEVYLLGGGSDISPTFAVGFYNGTEGGARMHYIADDGALTSGSCRSPYGFIMFGYTAGGSQNVEDVFMMDPMLSGSFPDSDPDPFVFYVDNGGLNSGITFSPLKVSNAVDNRYSYSNAQSNNPAQCWWKKNTTAQQFLAVAACMWTVSVPVQVYPAYTGGAAGQNAHTFSDDQIPVTYVRVPSYFGGMGYKGMSSFVNMNSAIHPIGTALTIQSNRDRIVAGNFSLPWDGSAPVV